MTTDEQRIVWTIEPGGGGTAIICETREIALAEARAWIPACGREIVEEGAYGDDGGWYFAGKAINPNTFIPSAQMELYYIWPRKVLSAPRKWDHST